MEEIISYKMCAVKVRNAKLRNYLKIIEDIELCILKCLIRQSGSMVFRRFVISQNIKECGHYLRFCGIQHVNIL
jgi:hypothetical protein